MGSEWWQLLMVWLLAFGAVARITRFLTADELAAPIRMWVTRVFGPESRAATLIECPWCASIWVAAPIAPLAYCFGTDPAFVIPALWLSLSYAYGLAATREEPDRT